MSTALSVLLFSSLIESPGVPAPAIGGPTLSISTDHSKYYLGDPVVIKLMFHNLSRERVSLPSPLSTRFDEVSIEAKGPTDAVFKKVAGESFCGAKRAIVIRPMASLADYTLLPPGSAALNTVGKWSLRAVIRSDGKTIYSSADRMVILYRRADDAVLHILSNETSGSLTLGNYIGHHTESDHRLLQILERMDTEPYLRIYVHMALSIYNVKSMDIRSVDTHKRRAEALLRRMPDITREKATLDLALALLARNSHDDASRIIRDIKDDGYTKSRIQAMIQDIKRDRE